MPRNVIVLLKNPESQAMIKESCKSKNIIFAEFEELVQAEIDQTGKQRRSGLWDSFDDILDRIQNEE